MLITILFTLFVFAATADNYKAMSIIGIAGIFVLLMRIEDRLKDLNK